MNDFMALMTRQQNERELALGLERRRLLRGADGPDPRFRRNPTVTQRLWRRLRTRLHGSLAGAPRAAIHSNG